MITPAPLEKQLVNIDLSKGMDERDRPELMNGVTTISNLVQDQTGSWTKRYGTDIGPVSDLSGTGTYPAAPKKVLATVKGWAVVADNGTFYHKQDQQGTLRAHGKHMDFSVTGAAFVGGSGPQALPSVGGYVLAAASCTTHDANVTFGAPKATSGQLHKLTVCERSSGTEYSYDLTSVTYPGTGAAGREVAMVFVGDRYLHVYVTNNPGSAATDISLIVIDILGVMPANEAAIVSVFNVLNSVAGGLRISDVVGGATKSYVLTYDSSVSYVLYTRTATGALFDSASFAPPGFTTMDINETSGDLWLLNGTLAVSGNANMMALSTANSAVTTHALFASGNPGTYVCCNTVTGGCQVVFNESVRVFGGSTINTIIVYNLALATSVVTTVVGAIYGWTPVSRPFFFNINGKHYMHVCKQDKNSVLSSHCVVDTSTFTPYWSNGPALAIPFGSFRIACNLEPFAAVQGALSINASFTKPYRIVTADGNECSAALTYQTAQRTGAAAFCRLRCFDSTAYGNANFGGSTHLAHGGINSYDGRNIVDNGFADMPTADLVVNAVVGTLNGSYRYVVVYRHVDANGSSTYSRTVGPFSAVNLAASTGKNTITIQPTGVTNRDAGNGASAPFVEVYRTKSGGTQFYLCASSQNGSLTPTQQVTQDATTGLMSFQDNLADATLASQAIMYRQPGTTNAPADRYSSPACKFVVQHKDRIFCADPYGQRVYYSSYFVDGEQPWFNPAFNFFMHAGDGPVTGLASMDGRLFVFKRNAIFVVDGDGPGEAGPTGNEFSPPQSLASRFGCIDHRSIVVVPDGIFYRSERGIEMVTRNLQVKWVGERIWNTVNSNPVTTGACVDTNDRVHWTMAASEPTAGVGGIAGAEVVYDMSTDAWSVMYCSGYTGVYANARQSVAAVVDMIGGVSTPRVVYADGTTAVFLQSVASPTSKIDFIYYVPFKIETGWIRQGPQARQRVSDVLFLAKKMAGSNHALKISIAYNYATAYTQSFTWEPTALNGLAIEELNLQPSKQQVLSIRVKIEDQAPADTVTYPIGNGAGCDILAITAEVAPKQGSPKLASGQKA